MNNNCVYTIDMGGTYLKGAVVDSNKSIVDDVIVIQADSSKDFSLIKDRYKEMIDSLASISSRNNLSSKALIISSPGPFDYQNGVSLMQHKYQAIYNISLIDLFKKELNLDIDILFENDVIAFLNGEITLAGKENLNACGITIGTGLGFALKCNNEVLRNKLGSPAVVLWNKPYKSGIAEDYISARGLKAIYENLSNISAESSLEVYNKALKQDKIALKAFEEFGNILTDIIKPVLEENEVKVLFLGGQVSKSLNMYVDILKNKLNGVEIIGSTSSNSTLIGLSNLYKY